MRSCGVQLSKSVLPSRPVAEGSLSEISLSERSPNGEIVVAGKPSAAAGDSGSAASPGSDGSHRRREAASLPGAQELEYLWQERSDKEIADELRGVLADVKAVTGECDALFVECVGGDAGNENEVISFGQLHTVTQRLIDRFGSRDPLVLAEIATLYRGITTSCDASRGIGVTEF